MAFYAFCVFQESQKTVAENGMKNYLRSRPPASTESLKRTKKDPKLALNTNLGPHPIFANVGDFVDEDTSQRTAVLDSLKLYKPNLVSVRF